MYLMKNIKSLTAWQAYQESTAVLWRNSRLTRTGSILIIMDEIKKRLKELYLKLKRKHGWSEDDMALNMKSSNNQRRNKEGQQRKVLQRKMQPLGGSMGTRRLIVGT